MASYHGYLRILCIRSHPQHLSVHGLHNYLGAVEFLVITILIWFEEGICCLAKQYFQNIYEKFKKNLDFFALPWQGKTLLGNLNVRQLLHEKIDYSNLECYCLLSEYRHYRLDVHLGSSSPFSRVWPLIYSAIDISKAAREYVIQCRGRLISVFCSKWSSAMALVNNVVITLH